MIIIASNGSGQLSSIIEGEVFKKVLSIFITAAILKLVQGRKQVEQTLLVHYLFLVSCLRKKLYFSFYLFLIFYLYSISVLQP
jgi:hypothetical protein